MKCESFNLFNIGTSDFLDANMKIEFPRRSDSDGCIYGYMSCITRIIFTVLTKEPSEI